MLYNKIIKNVIYPFFDIYFGTNTRQIYNQLLRSQWFSKDKIEEIQTRRMHMLIEHAYKNVPYYHKLFINLGLKPSDIKKMDDLKKIPILTKEIIRNNFEDLKAINYKPKEIVEWSTGGSTGQPLRFVRNSWSVGYHRAAVYRGYSWAGLDYFGDKSVSLFGSGFDVKLAQNIKFKIYSRIMRQISMPTFGLT